MNTRRCLRVADRINHMLQRELGQGVDTMRMLRDPLYTRDVLLVCDAFRGKDLASLAMHFRAAFNEVEESSAASADSTGFGASRSQGASGFLTSRPLEPLPAGSGRSKPWFSPGRWLGSRH